jgi:hypothetical protein
MLACLGVKLVVNSHQIVISNRKSVRRDGGHHKIRIGFYNPTMSRIGGGKWVTVNMINSLKANGYKIVVSLAEKMNSNRIFQISRHKLRFDKGTRLCATESIFQPVL